MAMTEARRAALKAYCRLDELTPEEDALLEREYRRAVAYLSDAGVAEPAEGTARRDLFDGLVDSLVLDAWDNRGAQTAGYALAANPSFRRDLNQMKHSEPVSDPDTGAGVF